MNHKYKINDKIKKTIKYFAFFLIIIIILNYIPCREISIQDILKISMITTITFASLDLCSPSLTLINN